MPGNKITILLCFFCLTAQICLSQKSPAIHYRTTAHFNVDDFKKMADSISREKARANGNDSLDTETRLFLDTITAMYSTLSLTPTIENAYVFREGNFVYMKREDGMPLLKYDLTSLDLLTIDSTDYRLTQKVHILSHPFDDTGYRYKQTITNESKKIHGYDCTKLIVEEYDIQNDYTRIFTIWATRDIKPALSIRAVCGLEIKTFGDYTPVSFTAKGPGVLVETEVINLNR